MAGSLQVPGDGATCIVVGAGDDSAGEIFGHTSDALAATLRVTPTMFPGGHTRVVEDPAACEARLRSVLAEG